MNNLLSKILPTVAIIVSAVFSTSAQNSDSSARISDNLKQNIVIIEPSDIEEFKLNEISAQDVAANDLAATSMVTRTVKISDNFKGLEVSGIATVKLSQGDKTSVEIKAIPEAIERTKFEVKKGVLKIYTTNKGNNNGLGTITVSITMPVVESLEFSGATSLKMQTNLQCASLEVEGTGATSMLFKNIYCTNLELDMTGAVNCLIPKVDVKKCDMDFSGAANVKVDQITASDIEIDSSGAATTKVHNINCNNLECEASGATNVYLSGKCTNLEAESSGAANLNFKKELTVTGSMSTSTWGAAKIR